MSAVRRLRAVVATAVTWGFALAGASSVLALVGYAVGFGRRLELVAFMRTVGNLAFRSGLIGASIGLTFALLVIGARRIQSFQDMSTRRFARWGFTAGAAFPLIVSGSYLLVGARTLGLAPLAMLPLSVVCGLVGATLATGTVYLARYGLARDRSDADRVRVI